MVEGVHVAGQPHQLPLLLGDGCWEHLRSFNENNLDIDSCTCSSIQCGLQQLVIHLLDSVSLIVHLVVVQLGECLRCIDCLIDLLDLVCLLDLEILWSNVPDIHQLILKQCGMMKLTII